MVESTVGALPEVVSETPEEALIGVLHVDNDAGFSKAVRQCLECMQVYNWTIQGTDKHEKGVRFTITVSMQVSRESGV